MRTSCGTISAQPRRRLVKKARPSARARSPRRPRGSARRPAEEGRVGKNLAPGQGPRGEVMSELGTRRFRLREALCPYMSLRSGEGSHRRASPLHPAPAERLPCWRRFPAGRSKARHGSAGSCRGECRRARCRGFHIQRRNGRLAALVRRLVVEAVGLHVVEAGLGDGDIAGHGRPEQRLLGLGNEVRNAAAALYSSGVWPLRTHSEAPPTKELCRWVPS